MTLPQEQQTEQHEELLDKKEIVARYRVSLRSIERLLRSGQMPAPVRLGRLVRWRLSDLQRWLAELPSDVPTSRVQ